MDHYCRICGRRRPNESFSGKGHATHVCKSCMLLPPEKRRHIEEVEEIGGFLLQSNISERNLRRLEELVKSNDVEVASRAKLLLEIGRVHPRKRRRVKFLVRERRDLLASLEQLGLHMYLPY